MATVLAASVALTLLFDIPMQEVRNVIIECNETSTYETEKNQTKPVEHINNRNLNQNIRRPIIVDDEPGSRNWSRGTFTKTEPQDYEDSSQDEQYRSSRYRNQNPRRQSLVRSQAYDEWDDYASRRTSMSEDYMMDDSGRSRNEFRRGSSILDDDREYVHVRERFSGGYNRSPMRDVDMHVYRRSISRDRPVMIESDVPMR